MHVKIQRKKILAVGIAGLIFSAMVIFFIVHTHISNQNSQTKIRSVQTALSLETLVGLPVRLTIPKIKVDAAIEHLGVTASGAVDAPKGPDDAAWFDLGPRPGETGSAVIVGHEGWKNGIRAVFDNLHTLAKGDKIYIEDDKGVIATFIVREIRTYGENQNPPNVFESGDGKAHLNLITCEGIWNKTRRSYSGRLVVFADEE